MARTACALHILVKTEAQALDIMKQLAAGANFQPSFRTCLKHYQSLDSDRLL